MLGTDFPYENQDVFVRAIDYINDPRIDPEAARAILEHNAATVLGISAAADELVAVGHNPADPAAPKSTVPSST